jgi:hypothetical protein
MALSGRLSPRSSLPSIRSWRQDGRRRKNDSTIVKGRLPSRRSCRAIVRNSSSAVWKNSAARRLPTSHLSGRVPDLPFLPLARLSQSAHLRAGRSQAPARQAGGSLRGAMDHPSATPPSDRRARVVRAEAAGRSACPCPFEALPSSFSVVSRIDVPFPEQST